MKFLLILSSLSISLINAAIVPLFNEQVPLAANERETVPGQYIVLFNEGMLSVSNGAENRVNDLIDEILGASNGGGNVLLHRYESGFAAKLTPDQVDQISERPEVDSIEPDQIVRINAVQVNPPSWGLARIHQSVFRAKNRYEYPDSAGEGVDVYVIDTGIYTAHQDFEGRAKWGFTAISGEDDVDGNGHGTHVASTIAGKTYGVAKKATVIAVKVLNAAGSGYMSDVVAGVEWAARQAQSSGRNSASNMSLGGGRSAALDRAVKSAVQRGLHMAVAAGNENTNACRSSPAAVEEAVTVGATDKEDKRAYFSNKGKCVDIFAPGHFITGAWIKSGTDEKTISGTSMASPHVAGVMALFLAEKEYSPKELKEELVRVAFPGLLKDIPEDTVNLLLNNNVNSQLYW